MTTRTVGGNGDPTTVVCRSDILKLVVELYDCEPRMFKEQFDKVKEAEGEEAMEDREEGE